MTICTFERCGELHWAACCRSRFFVLPWTSSSACWFLMFILKIHQEPSQSRRWGGLRATSPSSGAVTAGQCPIPNRPRWPLEAGIGRDADSRLQARWRSVPRIFWMKSKKYKKRRYTKCDMTEHHWCPSGSSPRPRKRVSRPLQSMDGRPTINRPYRPHLRVPGRVGRFEESD